MEKIFKFQDIDNQIREARENGDGIRFSEMQIFKEFALKNLHYKNIRNIIEHFWISNGYEIKNVDEIQKDEVASEIDFYFINKKDNQFIIPIIEIKDLSLKTLKIYDFFQFISRRVNVLEKDIKFSESIFPMFCDKCYFIRVNIVKYSETRIDCSFYEYKPKEIKWKVRDLNSYRNWKKLSKRKFINLLITSQNVDLRQLNLNLLKRTSYDKNILEQILINRNNNLFIKNMCLSVGDMSKLANPDCTNHAQMIIKIDGAPGSGKTIFAFLLFITEKRVLLIISNRALFNEFKNKVKTIAKENYSDLVLIGSVSQNKEINEKILINYKLIVIDESQNIDNDILINIAKFCYCHHIKLFLLSDYRQNIYVWDNGKNISGNNVLEQKEDQLKTSLKNINPSQVFICDWYESNRINISDLKRIQRLIFGSAFKSKKSNNPDNNFFIKIYPCEEITLENLQNKYLKKDIFIVSHFNWDENLNQDNSTNYKFFNQYQQIGSEHESIAIYLPYYFEYDKLNDKLIYHFKQNGEDKYVSDDTLKAWLYVAFTRATEEIRIFVDAKSKYKKDICEYFNKRLEESLSIIKNNGSNIGKNKLTVNITNSTTSKVY